MTSGRPGAVFVTGAGGFIGAALCARLTEAGWRVRGLRRAGAAPPPVAGVDWVGQDDPDWPAALAGCDAVIHLAAIAHRRAPPGAHRAVTVEGTRAIAEAARSAGAPRFIYMSSIKAAARSAKTAARETDAGRPDGEYGETKLEAERLLAAMPGLSSVCLRPPLVHAADAKANFAALLALANVPAPLPLGGFTNARNFIARDSVIEAVQAVLAKPDGPAGVFHLADQPALSTSEILDALRRGLGRRPLVNAAPLGPAAIRLLAAAAPTLAALTESLPVDDSKFRAAYGYGPLGERTSAEALTQTARAWKSRP